MQCQASIYTLSLCRRHSWRVRLAMQETLTPPGHLVSPLVCRGPWMSTVVCCWCHSDGASVLLYFTFHSVALPILCSWNARWQLKNLTQFHSNSAVFLTNDCRTGWIHKWRWHIDIIFVHKTFSFRKYFDTVLIEKIRIAKFSDELFVMLEHFLNKLNVLQSSSFTHQLREIV